MKLSTYAKKIGVSYSTVLRMWKRGELDAYQLPTGTIVVREDIDAPDGIVIYARVSLSSQKEDLERQVERLKMYALGNGYQVDQIVKEIASGLNDKRPKLSKVLKDKSVGIIIVEHKERLTRFGFNYIQDLLEVQNRSIEVLFPDEIEDELVQDFTDVITSMCARIYGRSGNKNRASRVAECIKNAYS